MDDYRRRLVDPLLDRLLAQLPAVFLVGPRATGKTTTAVRRARTVVRLDRPEVAAVFRAAPDAALRDLEEPVLLDEWQVVPEVLGAVKRAVDSDFRPGRFLVTGSVRADLEAPGWPGTGRLVRMPMYGMTVGEQEGIRGPKTFIDSIAAGDQLAVPAGPPDLPGYVDLLLRSGFPEPALQLVPEARDDWLRSYVDQMVTRDADEVEAGRDPALLRRYFEAYVLTSAAVVNDNTIYEAAGINHRTARAYERLLSNLMVVERIPAWTSNRLKRLVVSPRRYVVDAALVAAVLRVDRAGVMRDGNLLGRLLETFVVSQLRAELPVAATRPLLYHLRQEQGRHEIDLLAELAGGDVIGIEVKATSAPRAADARHLVWLHEKLGERFRAGVLFHTGPRVFPLGDRITAAPIATLWGSGNAS